MYAPVSVFFDVVLCAGGTCTAVELSGGLGALCAGLLYHREGPAEVRRYIRTKNELQYSNRRDDF
jgi:hypothetical protein